MTPSPAREMRSWLGMRPETLEVAGPLSSSYQLLPGSEAATMYFIKTNASEEVRREVRAGNQHVTASLHLARVVEQEEMPDLWDCPADAHDHIRSLKTFAVTLALEGNQGESIEVDVPIPVGAWPRTGDSGIQEDIFIVKGLVQQYLIRKLQRTNSDNVTTGIDAIGGYGPDRMRFGWDKWIEDGQDSKKYKKVPPTDSLLKDAEKVAREGACHLPHLLTWARSLVESPSGIISKYMMSEGQKVQQLLLKTTMLGSFRTVSFRPSEYSSVSTAPQNSSRRHLRNVDCSCFGSSYVKPAGGVIDLSDVQSRTAPNFDESDLGICCIGTTPDSETSGFLRSPAVNSDFAEPVTRDPCWWWRLFHAAEQDKNMFTGRKIGDDMLIVPATAPYTGRHEFQMEERTSLSDFEMFRRSSDGATLITVNDMFRRTYAILRPWWPHAKERILVHGSFQTAKATLDKLVAERFTKTALPRSAYLTPTVAPMGNVGKVQEYVFHVGPEFDADASQPQKHDQLMRFLDLPDFAFDYDCYNERSRGAVMVVENDSPKPYVLWMENLEDDEEEDGDYREKVDNVLEHLRALIAGLVEEKLLPRDLGIIPYQGKSPTNDYYRNPQQLLLLRYCVLLKGNNAPNVGTRLVIRTGSRRRSLDVLERMVTQTSAVEDNNLETLFSKKLALSCKFTLLTNVPRIALSLCKGARQNVGAAVPISMLTTGATISVAESNDGLSTPLLTCDVGCVPEDCSLMLRSAARTRSLFLVEAFSGVLFRTLRKFDIVRAGDEVVTFLKPTNDRGDDKFMTFVARNDSIVLEVRTLPQPQVGKQDARQNEQVGTRVVLGSWVPMRSGSKVVDPCGQKCTLKIVADDEVPPFLVPVHIDPAQKAYTFPERLTDPVRHWKRTSLGAIADMDHSLRDARADLGDRDHLSPEQVAGLPRNPSLLSPRGTAIDDASYGFTSSSVNYMNPYLLEKADDPYKAPGNGFRRTRRDWQQSNVATPYDIRTTMEVIAHSSACVQASADAQSMITAELEEWPDNIGVALETPPPRLAAQEW